MPGNTARPSVWSQTGTTAPPLAPHLHPITPPQPSSRAATPTCGWGRYCAPPPGPPAWPPRPGCACAAAGSALSARGPQGCGPPAGGGGGEGAGGKGKRLAEAAGLTVLSRRCPGCSHLNTGPQCTSQPGGVRQCGRNNTILPEQLLLPAAHLDLLARGHADRGGAVQRRAAALPVGGRLAQRGGTARQPCCNVCRRCRAAGAAHGQQGPCRHARYAACSSHHLCGPHDCAIWVAGSTVGRLI